jgi:hypothetical protein
MSGAYPGNGGADTGTDTGVGAGVGTGTDTGAGAGAGTDTGAGAGAGTDTGAGAGAGAGARQGVNPITQTGTNEGRIKKLKRKIANSPTAAGLGAVGKKYIFNKNTGKKLLKGGLKGASMATLGTLGVAAGLASDNFSNVFTYGAAATMAGSKVGDNLYNLGGNIISGTKNGVQDVKDTYKYAKYGKEYAEQLDNKSIQQYFKNPDVIRTYQKKFANAQEASEAMEYAKECKKAGINDDDAIINSYKLNDSYSREQKKYIAGLSLTNTSGKDLKELKESLAERNLSNSQIKNIIDGIKNVNRMA